MSKKLREMILTGIEASKNTDDNVFCLSHEALIAIDDLSCAPRFEEYALKGRQGVQFTQKHITRVLNEIGKRGVITNCSSHVEVRLIDDGQTTVEGQIFVIPNMVHEVDESNSSGVFWLWFQHAEEEFDNMLFDTKTDTIMVSVTCDTNGNGLRGYTIPAHSVQVWARDNIGTGPHETGGNFNAHGFNDNAGNYHYGNEFPAYLPCQVFIGKKEGDIVTFILDGIKFRLRLAQKENRYFKHGTFEEALSEVCVPPYKTEGSGIKFGINEDGRIEKVKV